ncbi:MAG TPA: putative collagen-binding domain-containing protein [Acidobacteriota bacterium]|nr:putative collagen-binding domain-containing protein [Acidobacteriota bacterium]
MQTCQQLALRALRSLSGMGVACLFSILASAQVVGGQVAGPLRVSANPNYFMDANGTVLILIGSQTWNTLQDWGSNGTVQPIDFSAFVSFLTSHRHNFTLLWRTELPKFCGLPSSASSPPELTVSPHPWLRTGPGKATDGGLKFDLTKFDQVFFDRLRARAQALNNAGIFAGIYLFTGEWLNSFRCSSDGYPFTGTNNINGVDDGYLEGHRGTGSITMTAPNAITAFQDAYVEKVIDSLNDLPNVLWIVSEEAPSDSLWWNNHQISHIRAYESGQALQHATGFAALVGSSDEILYNSDADWVAPQVRVSPNRSCGSGIPKCKVNVNDSDHAYWEMWRQTVLQNRNYAWENFMSGNQVLFMDPYLLYYPRENRNLCISPTRAICIGPDARWEGFRNNLGYILEYSRKLSLASLTPRGDLSSTGFCLARTLPVGAEYLVYAPSGGPFTVDLSAMPSTRAVAVEWFNPSSGAVVAEKPIPAGSTSQRFSPPFSGDAVLHLTDTQHQHQGRTKANPDVGVN